ncbi:MAG: GWxTD domain-containing protein [Balneolales bacterium]
MKINLVIHPNYYVIVLLFAIIGSLTDSATAQRISYEGLKARDRVPTAYFDYNILPPQSPGENSSLIISFKIEHNFLNFHTATGDVNNDSRFSADVEIGVDVFKVENNELTHQERNNMGTSIRGTTSSRRSNNNGLPRQAIFREFWNGTAYASTYEQTQSNNQYLEGYIVRDLPPGSYDIASRFTTNQRTRNTNPRRITIPENINSSQALYYFIDETEGIDIPSEVPLLNMGRNVFYGKDFNTLILIPEYDDQIEYRLQLKKLEINRRDTTILETVFDEVVKDNEIHAGLAIQLAGDDNGPVILDLSEGETNYTYALKHIPNRRYENAQYRMELWKDNGNGENVMIGSRVFMNRWVDIPASLLNVDVAIDMMRFIVDDETLESLKKGNAREREKKFREFWKQRNPTPETEYNELMVEYYKRIDHAFENFGSPQMPGYESDMGKVYIRNGEPLNVTRRLPPDQPAIQVWEYPSRNFVFVATSGFGDYELRETHQK